jgi:hypothetical protein
MEIDSEYDVKIKILRKIDWDSAVMVLDASNLSGVVYEFKNVMDKICSEAFENHKGIEWKNHHPIALMYAEKINQMTSNDSSDNWSEAYWFVKHMAEVAPLTEVPPGYNEEAVVV